jgi:hypothetical protein
VLTDESYAFLLVASRLEKSDRRGLTRASDIAGFCDEHGYRFYCLTASPQSEIEQLKSELGLKYDFCFTDEITLKTIIRANPGLVLLHRGVVTDKWHWADMPDAASLKPNLLGFSLERQAARSANRLCEVLSFGFLLFALAVFHFRRAR